MASEDNKPPPPGSAASAVGSDRTLASMSKAELSRLMRGLSTKDEQDDPSAGAKEHKFWDTQPVPKMGEQIKDHGPIETKIVSEVQAEPYQLPAGFEWSDCDMTDERTVDEVYNLLANNYVEDEGATFRFDYSRDFLKWALLPPGFRKDWHLAVRGTANQKLFGFITAIPARVRAHSHEMPMVEINYLCVHKKLRAKRLGPVLIKEITRRVNVQNVWQAVYTAGAVLPKPVATTRYNHRSLNPKKLIEIGFSRLNPKLTMTSTIKMYKLPDEPATPGLRPMVAADVPAATRLLNAHLAKFKLAVVYDEHDLAHWFLPRAGVISTYVVSAVGSNDVTDLLSFYLLPSSILNHPKYNQLKAAYSYYTVCTTAPLKQLMNDALILAQQAEVDVFNCLNVLDNEPVFKDLKFGLGDGHLQYYLYNWKCPDIQASEVGIVLL